MREAKEEAGVESEVVEHIETDRILVRRSRRRRAGSFSQARAFLFASIHLAGDTADHDWEVNEARWVPIDEAARQFTFENERRVVDKARERIKARGRPLSRNRAGSSEIDDSCD